MERYKPYTRIMAGMLLERDKKLRDGSDWAVFSIRTKAWISRREEFDTRRDEGDYSTRQELYIQAWKDDRTLWFEFFERQHGPFPGLTENELMELLKAPESELKPVVKHAAYRIFGPKRGAGEAFEVFETAEEAATRRFHQQELDKKWEGWVADHNRKGKSIGDAISLDDDENHGSEDKGLGISTWRGGKSPWDTYSDPNLGKTKVTGLRVTNPDDANWW